MWYISEDKEQNNKEQNKGNSRKVDSKKSSKKTVDIFAVDFITKLLLVAGKNAILVVCDKLSKMTHFVAMTEETSVEGLAMLSRDNVWKLCRLPESVILDIRSQFAVELMKKLNKMLEIETKLSTLLHLQTNGQMKRMN